MDEDIDTHTARDIVQAWMNQHDVTPTALAQAAGLDRTVVYRFLEHARPMQLRTAIRIYTAVQGLMDPQKRRALLIAFGLLEIAQMLSSVDGSTQSTYVSDEAKALIDLANGIELGRIGRHVEAVEKFRHASSIPMAHLGIAMYAACERVRSLIELGCLNAARDEVSRINTRFGNACGIVGLLELLSLRLQLAFALGDHAGAERMLRRLAFEAELHRATNRRSEALYYGALLRMADGMRAIDPKRRDAHLAKAARYLRLHDDYESRRNSDDLTSGLRALRWAELHRARRADEDARSARRLAHQLLRSSSAMSSVCIEIAKIALERDQLSRSRILAAEAREIASSADHGLTVAHASYVLAIADMMEENYVSALDHAIVTAALIPSWCYEDGTPAVDFMRSVTRSAITGFTAPQRIRFEQTLRQRIEERRGPFAVLPSLSADKDRRQLHVFGSVTI